MEITQEELVKCLICGEHKCNNRFQSKGDSSLISKHLQVIFLLRNILEVPTSKLVTFLQGHPNLESWLSVCDKCREKINHCKSIYHAVLEAQSKFKRVKQEIIQVLKESALIKQEISQEELDEYSGDKPLDIVEEIRGFVYQNPYQKNIDPFISGDRLAYHKLCHKVDKVIKQLDEEDDNQSWVSNFNDDDPQENQGDEWIPSDNEPAATKMVTKKSTSKRSHPSSSKTTCTSAKSISCPEPNCYRKFFNNSALTRHLQGTHGTQLEDLLRPCQFCGKKFPKSYLLQKHIRSVHEQTDNKFKCDLCGIGKSSNFDLNLHRKNCKGSSISCPVTDCQFKCSNYTALNYHVRNTHQDNIEDPNLFPFRCLECEDHKVFLSEEQLKTHLTKKHPGKGYRSDKTLGPFICETCGATFPTKYSLTNHRNKNTKCKRLRGLVKQEKVEDGPVICDICGGTYKNKGLMSMHKKAVHERRFVKTCEICGEEKNGKKRMEEHLWKKHNIGDEGKWGGGGMKIIDKLKEETVTNNE